MFMQIAGYEYHKNDLFLTNDIQYLNDEFSKSLELEIEICLFGQTTKQ